MAIIDRIKYDGTGLESKWIIYKYPGEDFVIGSQLIVNQSQEVIFFKGGEALDVFGPGTHTLQTGNLPLLNQIVNLPFGGKTPFSAEVYYVNNSANLEMKWGTSNPFPLEDPRYGLILSIRAHGQYGLRIENSRLFVSKLIGAIPSNSTIDYMVIAKYFNGLINTKVKDIVSEFMITKRISFLEITTYIDEISILCMNAINEEFERFGVEILNFYIESITPPKEDYEKLKAYKEELALGENFYTKRRSFDLLDKFAENPSTSSIANAGLAVGMGFGISSQIENAYSNISTISNKNNSSAHNNVNASLEVNKSRNKVCDNCNHIISDDMKFCSECGELVKKADVCKSCGYELQAGAKFCQECGQKVQNYVCGVCNKENLEGAKFCQECGNKL